MRVFRFALAGFGALALQALVPDAASAQGVSLTFNSGPLYRPAPVYRPYRRYRPVVYRPVPVAPRYARPVVYDPGYLGPRCRMHMRRVWTGYGWAEEPRRICR